MKDLNIAAINRIILGSVAILLSAIVLSGCGGSYSCVPAPDEEAMITWGIITGESTDFDGYVMMTNGQIFKETWTESKPITPMKTEVDEVVYCNFRSDLLDLYQKTQATNQPADSTHYIEYMVPQRNLKLRARWNPKFDNVGNEEWKKLWKRLNLILEQDAD